MTTPDPKATLPSGKIIIEEAPFDGAHHGRVDGDWRPVAEEAPADNKQYARQNGGWSEVTAEGVDYGTGLTKDVSATPPIVNLQPATDFSIGGIMEPPQTPPDSKQYVRVYDPTLPEGWKWAEATAEGVDYGIGLSKDETAAPPIVNLQPAGDSPATLGGVYVVDRVRNVEEGLELGIDGRLRAPLATDSLAGTILEPPPDDKGYVRRRDPTGVSQWVPPATTTGPDFGTGLALDDPADPADPQVVNLTPAGDAPQFLGGVYVVDRVRNVEEGLELGIDGRLRAPLATDSLAGTLLEPPPDDRGYVRARSAAGVSAWVPPAETLIDFGTGLTKDETATPPIVHLQPATDFSIGGVMEPAQNGLAHSRQFDTLTQSWFWTPALTAGLQITSIIPDKAIYGPSEPLLTVHAYGMEFTGTCVIRVDGIDATTSYVSATELTFVLNPAVPISDSFHIITVHDPAAVAPDPVDGLGAEQFDFIKASTEVDYGTGLSLDTAPTPPIVHLQPAGAYEQFLGGVWVPPRSDIQGAEVSVDPAFPGKLEVPLATDLLAGSIVEPPPDSEKYVRTRNEFTGISSWEKSAAFIDFEIGLHEWRDPTTGERLNRVDLKPATVTEIGGLLEVPQLPDDGKWVRTWRGWETLPPGSTVEAGIGLEKTGDVIDLVPPVASDAAAGIAPEIGGVYTTPRSDRNAVEIDPQGHISVPPATTDLMGAITEAPSDGTKFARTNEGWANLEIFDIHDLENRLDALSGQSVEVDIGLEKTDSGVINLVPPKPSPTPEIGGVYGTPRSERNGIEIDGYGHISAPLATPELAGTIIEPVADAKGYVRTTQLDGTSEWVPPASTDMATHTELGTVRVPARNDHNQGLDLDDNGFLFAPPATHEHLGTLLEPRDTRALHARVRDGTTGNAEWEAFEPGIGDVSDTVNVYGRTNSRWIQLQPGGTFPPASIVYVQVNGDTMQGPLYLYAEGALAMEAVTVSQLERMQVQAGIGLTQIGQRIYLKPATVTEIGGLLEVPQLPVDGKWVRTFRGWETLPPGQTPLLFRYGLVQTNDIVDVKPATNGSDPSNPPELGGVYATKRDDNQGLVIDSYGHISVPLATDLLAGSIVEPPPDAKGYVRTTQLDGTSQWVPPAASTLDEPPPDDRGYVRTTHLDGTSQWVPPALPPLATPDEPGLIEEPVADAKGYVRTTQLDGTSQWVPPAPSAGGVTISDTPPVNPAHESMWWESDTGDLFIFYEDPSGPPGQWVQVNGESAPPSVHVADDPPMLPTENQLWWDSNAGSLNLWYTDPDSSQWVQVAGPPPAPGIAEAPVDGVPYSRQDATWVATTALAATPGDVKQGFQVNDHAGWVKLDGRAVVTLTVTQQAEAALLGFTTNIPDATGSVLIQNGGVMGAVSGNMAKTIAVANLPAHNMTSGGHDAAAVTSSSAGAHDHFDPMYGWVDVDAIPTGVPVHCSDEGNRISLGGHTHTIDMPNHTHTVALGGSGTPLDTTPKSLSANAFLYLGT